MTRQLPPIVLADRIWKVLDVLSWDEEPSLEYEEQYGGSNMDPLTLSINTVRGEAMHAVVQFATWWRLEHEGQEFFASHDGRNPLRIFRWQDAPDATMSFFDVSASGWSGHEPYSSPGPGGIEWLARLDSRITGAWVVGNQAGFLWSANTGPNRPQPYVKAMIVDTTTRLLVSEPDIWNPNFAWAYPAACPNANGLIGISLFCGGGGESHPTHVVGYLDGNRWVLATSRSSTHGPIDGKWGDYLSCEVHGPDGLEWVASGYTLQNGTDRQFIEPQYVQFGAGA
jgi:hypothetical protein